MARKSTASKAPDPVQPVPAAHQVNTPSLDPAPDSIIDIADSPIVKADSSFGAKLAELTPKQRKLVSLLCLSGISKAEAYRQAYDTKQTGTNLSATASKMCKRVKVAAVVSQFRHNEWSGAISDGPEIRRVALSVMRDIALNGQAERNKLLAAVHLGKTNIAGLYSGPATVHQHLHLEGLNARDILLEKMTKLFGNPQPVDSIVLASTNVMPLDGTAQASDVIEGQVIEAEPGDDQAGSDPDSNGPPAGPGTPPCE